MSLTVQTATGFQYQTVTPISNGGLSHYNTLDKGMEYNTLNQLYFSVNPLEWEYGMFLMRNQTNELLCDTQKEEQQ